MHKLNIQVNKNGKIEITPDEFDSIVKSAWLDAYQDCQIDNDIGIDESKALNSWSESKSLNQTLCYSGSDHVAKSI